MNICLEEGIFVCNVQCDTKNAESCIIICIIISAVMQPPKVKPRHREGG